MTFAEVVKDSYNACYQKIKGWAQDYPDMPVPTDGMVADDILDHYEEYKDLNISDLFEFNEWCEKVANELARQHLDFIIEK